MAKKEQMTLNGEPVGRVKAGWLLFKEAFRFMWADKEMLWVPVIAALANMLLLGAIIALIVAVVLSTSEAALEKYPVEYLFMFLVYLAGAFTLSLSQAAVAHMVFVRAHGGDATLGQALTKAFSHWGNLFIWSAITATVGLVLRAIYDRSELLGKIITAVLGAAWGVMTYFVVPAIVIDNKKPVDSIKKSALVFKQTWGESLVSNISFGLLFFLAYLFVIVSLGGLVVAAYAFDTFALIIVAFVLFVIWIIAFALVSSSISAVLRVLLYIYATEGTVPENFNRELLEKMLARKKVPETEGVDSAVS